MRTSAGQRRALQAIELTFDDPGAQWFRADWQAIADAGFPSYATRDGGCGAPHISTVVGENLSRDAQQAAVEHLEPLLPFDVGVAGIVLFGKGPYVLARAVEAPQPLLAAVAALIGAVDEDCRLVRRTWIPHVTLARKTRVEDVGPTCAVLQDPRRVSLTVSGLRFCDPVAGEYVSLMDETGR